MAEPKVIVTKNAKSEEDLAKIEAVLAQHLPSGLKWKRDHLPLMGFLWEWDKDGWEIQAFMGGRVASIYMDGRHIQVWGSANLETLKPFAKKLAEALDCDIHLSLA